MEIRLEMDCWVINDDYFINEDALGDYDVYTCGTDEREAERVYSSESFEECLTWIWNSL